MITVNEESRLAAKSNTDILYQPRSRPWLIFQGILYIIGSICFTGGSCMYFTRVFRSYSNALTIGGWSFTIGSVIFLFADLQEWWAHRTDCCFNYDEQRIEEISLHSLNTSNGDKPSKIELNVVGSMCGIAFYLAGSILFIPIFESYMAVGEWFFIFGSTFCSVSLIWKMYRSACQNFEEKFHWKTLLKDIPLLIMDIFSTVGNILFFIGTILFLSYINTSDSGQNRAALFFVVGSGCFLFSSLILQYTICSSS